MSDRMARERTVISKSPDMKGQVEIFLAMVRKQLTIMTRYPVDLVASFAQVFFMIMVFTLAPIELEIVIAFGILGPLFGYGVYQWAERRARILGTLAEF